MSSVALGGSASRRFSDARLATIRPAAFRCGDIRDWAPDGTYIGEWGGVHAAHHVPICQVLLPLSIHSPNT